MDLDKYEMEKALVWGKIKAIIKGLKAFFLFTLPLSEGECERLVHTFFSLKGKEICLRSKSFLGKIERETR